MLLNWYRQTEKKMKHLCKIRIAWNGQKKLFFVVELRNSARWGYMGPLPKVIM